MSIAPPRAKTRRATRRPDDIRRDPTGDVVAGGIGRRALAGIAAIYEPRSGADRYYFAMERVDGLPLTTFAREPRLSIHRRIELFAVHRPRQRDVIHRDLSHRRDFTRPWLGLDQTPCPSDRARRAILVCTVLTVLQSSGPQVRCSSRVFNYTFDISSILTPDDNRHDNRRERLRRRRSGYVTCF